MPRLFLALCFGLFAALSVSAEAGEGQSLVCFTQKGLEGVLSKIVNIQQFLRHSPWQSISKREFNKLGCAYAPIPKGTTAVFNDFYISPKGFFFPLFQLRYDSTTGATMYSADGIFSTKDWKLVRAHSSSGSWEERIFLVPKKCETLNGFIVNGQARPDYVGVPEECGRSYIVM